MCMINETTPPSVIQEIIPEEIRLRWQLYLSSLHKAHKQTAEGLVWAVLYFDSKA